MRAQGALEYLIIIAAVLGITAVVVVFLTGAFSGSSAGADLSKCRLAAANCERDLTLGLGTSCFYCEEACKDSKGLDLISGTLGCGEACLQCKSGSVVSQGEVPSIGLMSEWALDEGKGTLIADATGNTGLSTYYGETFNHGALTNGPVWSAGRYGGGVSFDGTDDYVNVPASAALNAVFGSESFTLSAWVYPQDWVDYRGIINKRTSIHYSASPGGLFADATGIRFVIGTGLESSSANMISYMPSLNEWHHIAGVANITNITLYVDGILRASTAITVNPPTNSEPLSIGSFYSNVRTFKGMIDSARIWNRPLNLTEIQSELASSRPVIRTISAWEFDDGSGTAANDTHIWVARGVNNALSFDTDDFILTQRSGEFIQNMTVTAWFNQGDWLSRAVVGRFHNNAGYDQGWMLYRNSGWPLTNLGWLFYYNTTVGRVNNVLPTYAGLSTGVWYHASAVIYSNGSYATYLNGAPYLSGTAPNFVRWGGNNTYTSVAVAIGRCGGSLASWYYNGSIDDVRIYDRSLSPQEIANICDAG